MATKLLLVLGPTGVGKSTVIHQLSELDSRFSYISPYTTRELRRDERDKVPVSIEEFNRLEKEGRFVVVNKLYGVLYGTPTEPILEAFKRGDFPVLDWPVQQIEPMRMRFPGRIFSVYVEPPSAESLRQRLSSGGFRDRQRLIAAEGEYSKLLRGDFEGSYDYRVVSKDGAVHEVAILIYNRYLESLKHQQNIRIPTANINTEASAALPQLTESELDMQAKMKRDGFRKVRGGKAVMLDVYCGKCDTKVLWYQKDGLGSLLRCYLNRIHALPELEKLQKDPNIKEPKDMPQLVCPNCETVLGTPMRYADGRLAFRLRPGFIYKRRSKDTGY